MTYIIKRSGYEVLNGAQGEKREFLPFDLLHGAVLVSVGAYGTVTYRLTDGRIVHVVASEDLVP